MKHSFSRLFAIDLVMKEKKQDNTKIFNECMKDCADTQLRLLAQHILYIIAAEDQVDLLLKNPRNKVKNIDSYRVHTSLCVDFLLLEAHTVLQLRSSVSRNLGLELIHDFLVKLDSINPKFETLLAKVVIQVSLALQINDTILLCKIIQDLDNLKSYCKWKEQRDHVCILQALSDIDTSYHFVVTKPTKLQLDLHVINLLNIFFVIR